MARIDSLYLENPCSRSRSIVYYLTKGWIPISRDRDQNLLRRKGLRVIYQKPRTTAPGYPSNCYPCLVDLSMVTTVDQVWTVNITYHSSPERLPLPGGRWLISYPGMGSAGGSGDRAGSWP